MRALLVLLGLMGCDASVDGPWQGFSIHPVVEAGGTTMPHQGHDTPLQVGPAALDGSCVAEAEVGSDPFGSGFIEATLTDDCKARFADFSEQNVGRKIALVVDGEVLSAPIVQERIDGGEIAMSLGGESTPEEAAALLARLSGK